MKNISFAWGFVSGIISIIWTIVVFFVGMFTCYIMIEDRMERIEKNKKPSVDFSSYMRGWDAARNVNDREEKEHADG